MRILTSVLAEAVSAMVDYWAVSKYLESQKNLYKSKIVCGLVVPVGFRAYHLVSCFMAGRMGGRSITEGICHD
ncbi:hypothetical protein GCM10022212_09830 [Actimicrobium antarcticum]|uniref:Uncharacterized protein n=1 Tax=Actimicrobium antarcticum TaxID=1051899 RepID=A0ABP7SV55_9BURK